MAQHDYNIANQSGADFRADLNNALSAIATVNSGATEPSTTFAHQLWVDTSSNVLKIRNAANNAWITTGVSITASNTFTGNITGNADTATTLATARTINGVSFDGSANISFDTDSVSEGSSNLYFTNERVDDQVNTLLQAGTGIQLTYDDTAGTLTIANTNDADITGVVAGNGLTGGGTAGTVTLNVAVDDSSIEIDSDALQVKASGITNAMLAGSITNAKLSNSSITINSNSLSLGGTLTLDTDDIGEGSSNLYYTQARFDSAFTAKSTSDLSEGTNLYYTDARARASISEDSIQLSYNSTTGVLSFTQGDTDTVSEGSSNLYYTSARANADFDTRLATKSTTNLSEGTNLYYTTARFDSAFTGKDTDDLSEGSTNVYYTDARANSAIDARVTKSFVDALNVQAASVDANSVALGTDTTGNYVATITGTANKVSVSGSGSESANITLSLPDDVQIASDLTVAGNLTVNGTLTSLDTTNLDIEDNLFQLNAGLTGSPVNDSGMLINRGSSDNGIFMWDESTDKFTLGLTTADGSATGNITLSSLGTLVANIEGDVTGSITGTVSSISNHSTSDLSEGTNLYYTDARFDTRLGTKDTDDVSEGSSNLYYTTTRFDSAFSGKSTSDLSEGSNLYYTSARANSDFDTRLATKDTGDLAEGSNLYYTDARVQAVSINNVVEDTTPQLGGNLDLNSNDITGTGDINITGSVTADGLTVDGNIGFGTTSPNSYSGYTTLTFNNATNGGAIDFENNGTRVGTIFSDQTSTILKTVANVPLLFGSNDAEKMRIDSSGNVGIGETAPLGKLHVKTADSGASVNTNGNELVLENSGSAGISILSGTTGDGNIFFGDSGGSVQGRLSYSHNGDYLSIASTGASIFYNGGSERMRIDSSGNCGIGTSSPSAKCHLYTSTSGAVNLGIQNSQRYWKIETVSEKLSIADVSAGGLARMTFDTSGRVGIGVTNPSAKLDVSVSGSGTQTALILNNSHGYGSGVGTAAAALQFRRDSGGGGESTPTAQIHSSNESETTSNPSNLVFSTKNNSGTLTEAMRIDSSGRLGIGTTSPSSELHVDSNNTDTTITIESDLDGSSLFTSGIDLKREGTSKGSRIESIRDASAGGVGLNFLTTANNAAEVSGTLTSRMVILEDGNVGIGTSSPSAKLEVQDANGVSLKFGDLASYPNNVVPCFIGTGTSALAGVNGDLVLVPRTSDAGKILFATGNGGAATEKVRIANDGNVGIGTSTPATGLHVVSGGGTTPFRVQGGGNAGVNIMEVGYAGGGAGANFIIDDNGRCGIGTTSPSSELHVDSNGSKALVLNRRSSDGNILELRKDNSTVGIIGSQGGDSCYIEANGSGLRISNSNRVLPCGADGAARDNVIDLGSTGGRFDDIYATNGTIQTSDRNEKQDIEALTDAETRVAVAAKGLLRKFRWQSAVEEKGDEARIHFGIIAQDLQDAFAAEGLDAGDYAMFISDTWTDDDGVEQTRLGVRYSELLAFIIAAI